MGSVIPPTPRTHRVRGFCLYIRFLYDSVALVPRTEASVVFYFFFLSIFLFVPAFAGAHGIMREKSVQEVQGALSLSFASAIFATFMAIGELLYFIFRDPSPKLGAAIIAECAGAAAFALISLLDPMRMIFLIRAGALVGAVSLGLSILLLGSHIS